MSDLYQKLGNKYNEYANNKKMYEADPTNGQQYADANQKLRDAYGIQGDSSSYQDLQRGQAYSQNQYDTRGRDMLSNNVNRQYNDRYGGEVNRLRDSLANYRYDANSDPTYQAYAQKFAREGQSAQDQTLANQSAMTGGRLNSWASAAASQVGQAYAQKTADMIPTLSEQGYNKLLSQYQMANDMSNQDYDRFNTDYNRQLQGSQALMNVGQSDRELLRNQNLDNVNFANSDMALKTNQQAYDYNAQANPLQLGQLNAQLYNANETNKYLPENLRLQQALQQGQLDGVTTDNQYKGKIYDSQLATAQYERNKPYYNPNSGVASKPTTYDKQQGVKDKITSLLYDVPQGSSSTYYPIQQLAQNRGVLNSAAGNDYVDALIKSEVARVAQAEGLDYNETLRKYGFSDLQK